MRATGEAVFADAAEADERLKSAQGALDIALIEAFREAAKRGRRGLVILGDPGSGKTTASTAPDARAIRVLHPQLVSCC